MSTVLTLFQQTLIMFILAGVGLLLYKGGKISQEGSKSLGNILIFAVLPCVIVNSFLVERTAESMKALGISALLAFVSVVIAMVVSRLIFRKDPIAAFACSFSNPGFFGVPLIVAAQSSSAVFYIAAFIGFINLFQWTFGVYLMTGNKESMSLKGFVKAPFFIALCIGLVLYFTGITLPAIVTKTITTITAINTPLAMFTVGVYLAQADIGKLFARKQNYLIAAVRLVVIPLITVGLMKLIPGYFEAKQAILIAAACPTGSNIAVYAHLHGKDYPYAVETVVLTTLLSIATIPVIVSLL